MENKIININLLDVIHIVLADRRRICIYSLVAGVLGVLVAFTVPKKYEASVVLAPEESGMGFSGSLSSLASMVGMDMKIGQTGDALYPEIYPDLISSTDFLVGLFKSKVTTDKTNETYTYYDYLKNHQKSAFYEYPMIWLSKLSQSLVSPAPNRGVDEIDAFRLSRGEYGIARMIQACIKCSVDKKTDVITITVKDQDPLIAATMVETVKEHLQTAITEYRTKKARVDLEYVQGLFEEARKQYDKARHDYAVYADANQDVSLQVYRMKEEDLENDMQLKYNIYTNIVEQMQLAQAKVQERTPAFTEVQKASVPVKHSNTPKVVVLIASMMVGLLIRLIMLAWKHRREFVAI